MDSVYVYYKLLATERDRALTPAHQVLDAGRPWCARARLMTRPDMPEGVATWMEVYEVVSDLELLEKALQAAVLESGLEAFTKGPRRSERFHELPPIGAALSD